MSKLNLQDESIVVLSHTTAALFWRAVREGRIARPEPCPIPSYYQSGVGYRSLRDIDFSCIGLTVTSQGVLAQYQSRTVTVTEGDRSRPETMHYPVGIALPPGILAPLDILVCSKSQGRVSAVVSVHVRGANLPPRSFYKIHERLYVTSPMLTFVQACLSNQGLPNIELGLEWCGAYALAAPSCPKVEHAKPILSASDVKAYVDSLEGINGTRKARDAAYWLVDGLASPREAEVYLMLVLPPALGGFGLPRPLINETIGLRGTAAEALTSDSHYIADLYYRDKKVIVEYDGEDDHERDVADVLRDKQRRSVLAALGYMVIVITRYDVQIAKKLRQKVEQIARALGVALPTKISDRRAAAQEALCKWLFNPNHDHLPFGYGYR